jgi:hypothetical protein
MNTCHSFLGEANPFPNMAPACSWQDLQGDRQFYSNRPSTSEPAYFPPILFGFRVTRLRIERYNGTGELGASPLLPHTGAQCWVKVTCQMLVGPGGLSLWSHASPGQDASVVRKDSLSSCGPLAGIQLYNSTEHYATSRKVAGSIPDEVIVIFNWPDPSSCTMALG